MWLEGLGQLKNPTTISGFEPSAFQLTNIIINICKFIALHSFPNNSLYTQRKISILFLFSELKSKS
jgi:hypothetical protein